MSTKSEGCETYPEDVVFELASRLLRGATIDVKDEAGMTWEATASTLARYDGQRRTLVLDKANAFDVLSELAERLSSTATPTPAPPSASS